MNIKLIERSLERYAAGSDKSRADRLELYRRIWDVQNSVPRDDAGTGEALDTNELVNLYWSGTPVMSVHPVAIDADVLADTAAKIWLVLADAGIAPAGEGSQPDWRAVVALAPVELAGTDPAAYLEAVSQSLDETGTSALVPLVLSLAIKPLIEPFGAAVMEQVLAGIGRNYEGHAHRRNCPVCGGEATLAFVGPCPSGVQNGRMLWCGQCGTKWEFERIRCPRCGTQFQTQMHYTSIDDDDLHRVLLCDVCHGYTRTFFTVTPEGVSNVPFAPEVEDVVMIDLDAVARDMGYGPRAQTQVEEG